MKRVIVIICLIFSVIGCNTNSIEKPDNLIEKGKMVDILYDMSLLEAIKSQNINGGISTKAGNEYIYKKYKIDSVQYVKSNKYYASNLEEYKKMYEEIKERLNKETKKIEVDMKGRGAGVPPNPNSTKNSDVPRVQ